MDSPDEENMVKWILIDSVENAEEVTETYDTDNHMKSTLVDSDLESDGISIISHNESSAEEEYNHCSRASDKIDNVTPVRNEDTMKWTLSDSEVVSLGLPSKTFFLDCLQEPIEELSEQELGTNQSNPKSDDVTIISESGSDFMNDNEVSLPKPKNENIEKFPAYIHRYFNGFVICTILLATISIFLGTYLDYTDKIENELHHYKKHFDNILTESDNIDKISKKDMMITLYLCEQKFKSGNNSIQQNVHECLVLIEEKILKKRDNMRWKEIEKLQKNLKIKEHYLNKKEKFLIKKEYKLLKAEMKFQSDKKQHNFKNKNRNHLKFDSGQRSYKTDHDFEYDENHVHKDLFKGNIKPKDEIHDERSSKGHWKNKKDEINDSNEMLRPVQEDFYAEKAKYFKMNRRNKFSENRDHQRQYNEAKKTKGSSNDKAIANNERKANYKHDKAKRMGKF